MIYSVFGTQMGKFHFDPQDNYIGTFDTKEKAINATLDAIELICSNQGELGFDKEKAKNDLIQVEGYSLNGVNIFFEIVKRPINQAN